jgi:hypothetical protein
LIARFKAWPSASKLWCDGCPVGTGIFVLSEKKGPTAAPELAGMPVRVVTRVLYLVLL